AATSTDSRPLQECLARQCRVPLQRGRAKPSTPRWTPWQGPCIVGSAMRAFASFTLILAVAACKQSGGDADSTIKPPPSPPIKVTAVAATEAPTPDVLVLTGTVTADQRSDVT